MPLSDVRCEECNFEEERFCKIAEMDELRCSKCGGRVKFLITKAPAEDWLKPHWNPNFEGEPIWIKSRRHYKQMLDKHGMVSRALGDHRNIKEI